MFVVLVAAPALGPRRLATQHLAAAAAAPEEAPASTRTRVYLLVGGSNQDGAPARPPPSAQSGTKRGGRIRAFSMLWLIESVELH